MASRRLQREDQISGRWRERKGSRGDEPLLDLGLLVNAHRSSSIRRLNRRRVKPDLRRRQRSLLDQLIKLSLLLVGHAFRRRLCSLSRRRRGRGGVLGAAKLVEQVLELVGNAAGALGRLGVLLLSEDEDRLSDLDETARVELDGDLDGGVDELVGVEVGCGGGNTPEVGREEVRRKEGVAAREEKQVQCMGRGEKERGTHEGESVLR